MSHDAPRRSRRIRVVLKARNGRDAAEGLRQVAAAARGADLDARVEVDLRDADLVGAARDAALPTARHAR